MFFSPDFLTQIGHIIIIVGVGAAWLTARKAKELVEVQRDLIDTLEKSLQQCKLRLDKMEVTVREKL